MISPDYNTRFSSTLLVADVGIVAVPGDYNNNGVVDAADYVLWRKGGPLANEVDTPGTVNGADCTAWRARFGNPGSGSGSGGSAIRGPRPARTLPVVLSPAEVARFFRAIPSLKQRTILMLAYGAGLRVGEVVELRLSDIDHQRRVIRVQQGKGKKDRYTMLSPEGDSRHSQVMQ